jgi:hypothetical protein
LRKECPEQYEVFQKCLKANNGDEQKCLAQQGELDACGKTAFRKSNNDANYSY